MFKFFSRKICLYLLTQVLVGILVSQRGALYFVSEPTNQNAVFRENKIIIIVIVQSLTKRQFCYFRRQKVVRKTYSLTANYSCFQLS